MDSDKKGSAQDQKRKVLRKLPPAGSRAGGIGGKAPAKGAGLFRPRSIKSSGKKSYPRRPPKEGAQGDPGADFGAKTASMPPEGMARPQGSPARRPVQARPKPPGNFAPARPKPQERHRPDGPGSAPQQAPARQQPRQQQPRPQARPQQAAYRQQPEQQQRQQAPTRQGGGYPSRQQAGYHHQEAGLRAAPRQEMREEALRRKAQPYDWGKTQKFSQDQRKFLERVFKQFADYLTTKLAPLLQTRVDVEYEGAKLRPYGTFLQGLYEPITIILMRIDPQFKGLVVIDFPLSFALIDRCLGGRGQPIEEVRYFTEIEVAILERVVMRFTESYQESWTEVKEIKPQYLEMQFNPQTVHIMKPSDPVVCISFGVKVGQAQGPVYIILPFEYLQSILPKANFEEFMLTRSSSSQVSPSVAPLFAKNLEQARVPVSVELGSTELMFSELAVLEVGDFIKLDQEITKPLRVKVNDRFKFMGRPGISESKLSVQITKVLQEGEEDFDV